MSTGVNDLLLDIAGRCNIKNKLVIRRGKELLTLLNSKGPFICSDTCKAVVCLELASSLSSNCLSRENAIKYSGCKKNIYINIYNNISKLLNLDKIYSVKEICLLIGLSDIQESAIKILEEFKKKHQRNYYNFEHPMYACAAVLAFCRCNHLKINILKLVEISRIKKSELEELAKRFLLPKIEKKKKIIEQNSCKKNTSFQPKVLNNLKGNEEVINNKLAVTGIMTDEEYKKWKIKMLEE